MGEPRACATCGQEVPAPAGYRTAAKREVEPAEKPVKAAQRVLEEEYKEADGGIGGWFAATAMLWCLAVIAAAMSAERPSAGLNVFGGGCAATAAVCLVGLLRCRATIRAWRDQKRAGGAG